MNAPFRHIDAPGTATATAPYNFVPLPEKVLTVDSLSGEARSDSVANGTNVDDALQPWRQHHRFLKDHHTGRIDLTLRTLTPLFTRSAATRGADGTWDGSEARTRPASFTTVDGETPAIPGSSIRGAIRTLFEIATFAKLGPLSTQAGFYRSVGNDRIGRIYRSEVVPSAGRDIEEKPRAGFLDRVGLVWMVRPVEMARVSHRVLDGVGGLEFSYWNNPRYVPGAPPHMSEVYVALNAKGSEVTSLSLAERAGHRRAFLVLTGSSPKKKREFVFFPSTPGSEIVVPDDVVEALHSDQQISNWQKRRYPADTNGGEHRLVDGGLAICDPVFYILGTDGDGQARVKFLGRAQMFRLPYQRSPADLLPDGHADAGLDLAEAVFGMVGDRGEIKGRVSFSTAVADPARRPVDGWYEAQMVPRMLASPKSTAYPHYLTQNGAADIDGHATYHGLDRTTLRGHKLYWHRPSKDPLHLATDPKSRELVTQVLDGRDEGRMHTVIAPVKAKVEFRARVSFTNLTDVELGALLTVVNLPQGCAHRLGMAKSLGLGSVRISVDSLTLLDPDRRYAPATTGDERADATGSGDMATRQRCLSAFAETVTAHAQSSGEPLVDRPEQAHGPLGEIARLEALFTLLSYDSAPDAADTESMGVEVFKRRLVLPTPQRVVGRRAPEVSAERQPGAGAIPDSRPPRRGSDSGRDGWQTPGRRGSNQVRRGASAPRSQPEVIAMTISGQTTEKGAPVLVDGQAQRYVFSPGTPIPSDLTEGSPVRVTIKVAATGPNVGQVVLSEDGN